MKNLENYGVLQLNTKEMNEIDGGIAPLVVYGGIFLLGVAVGVVIRLTAD